MSWCGDEWQHGFRCHHGTRHALHPHTQGIGCRTRSHNSASGVMPLATPCWVLDTTQPHPRGPHSPQNPGMPGPALPAVSQDFCLPCIAGLQGSSQWPCDPRPQVGGPGSSLPGALVVSCRVRHPRAEAAPLQVTQAQGSVWPAQPGWLRSAGLQAGSPAVPVTPVFAHTLRTHTACIFRP